MPPRYAYWTIMAGGLPTAFRAAEREELLPTFNRLKEKHPDAEMKYFARGQALVVTGGGTAGRRGATCRRPRRPAEAAGTRLASRRRTSGPAPEVQGREERQESGLAEAAFRTPPTIVAKTRGPRTDPGRAPDRSQAGAAGDRKPFGGTTAGRSRRATASLSRDPHEMDQHAIANRSRGPPWKDRRATVSPSVDPHAMDRPATVSRSRDRRGMDHHAIASRSPDRRGMDRRATGSPSVDPHGTGPARPETVRRTAARWATARPQARSHGPPRDGPRAIGNRSADAAGRPATRPQAVRRSPTGRPAAGPQALRWSPTRWATPRPETLRRTATGRTAARPQPFAGPPRDGAAA